MEIQEILNSNIQCEIICCKKSSIKMSNGSIYHQQVPFHDRCVHYFTTPLAHISVNGDL